MILTNLLHGDGNHRIWGLRKVDVLFVVGVAGIVYGFAVGRVELIIAGAGIAGIPLTQRGDKA